MPPPCPPRWPSRRRLLVARTTSNLGNGTHPLALSFGVLALPDGSAAVLSLLLASQALAVIAMLPLGGVVADRVGSTRVIGTTEILLSGVVAPTGCSCSIMSSPSTATTVRSADSCSWGRTSQDCWSAHPWVPTCLRDDH